MENFQKSKPYPSIPNVLVNNSLLISILQHGLLDCSWSWFLNNSKKLTLPYILADEGYDVWLTNNRGNKYSIGHAHYLNPGENKQYWDFSFDEIAKYDVKANVLHVKKIT